MRWPDGPGTLLAGTGGLGPYAPVLDVAGNSVNGQRVAGYLSEQLGLNPFTATSLMADDPRCGQRQSRLACRPAPAARVEASSLSPPVVFADPLALPFGATDSLSFDLRSSAARLATTWARRLTRAKARSKTSALSRMRWLDRCLHGPLLRWMGRSCRLLEG
ncbi:MAG TPA: hypothetical protein VLJ88_10330 [Propionibacteriaceae bacterium]|nr:hypothetical protein [Propionibacteriaceae bacterium]